MRHYEKLLPTAAHECTDMGIVHTPNEFTFHSHRCLLDVPMYRPKALCGAPPIECVSSSGSDIFAVALTYDSYPCT